MFSTEVTKSCSTKASHGVAATGLDHEFLASWAPLRSNLPHHGLLFFVRLLFDGTGSLVTRFLALKAVVSLALVAPAIPLASRVVKQSPTVNDDAARE